MTLLRKDWHNIKTSPKSGIAYLEIYPQGNFESGNFAVNCRRYKEFVGTYPDGWIGFFHPREKPIWMTATQFRLGCARHKGHGDDSFWLFTRDRLIQIRDQKVGI